MRTGVLKYPSLILSAHVWFTMVVCSTSTCRAQEADLIVAPSTVTFTDIFDRRQLQVYLGDRDVTRRTEFVSSDPRLVRVDETGSVVPVADGEAVIGIRVGKKETTVRVKLERLDRARQID